MREENYKLKFSNFIKYWIVKILTTCFLFVISGQQGYEGILIYTVFTFYATTISVAIIYLFYLTTNFFFLKQSFAFVKLFFFFITLIVINDVSCLIVDRNTDVISAILSGKSWQIIYKICDIISLVFSGYLFFGLPYRRLRSAVVR